ncbi:MAG TPA: PEP-CTERM sorting domain-containing protein [Cyanothece sp. UBA12306]|nr:PEP-CTERM sorting domain-containing protein [Cyanothece sp. UBA12306]
MTQKSIGLLTVTFLNLGLVTANSAEAITFNLHWTGQTLGYQLKGSFSYNENQVNGDGIVRQEDLTSFDIAFIDPNGNIFKEFFDNHLTSSDFNFNFDTNTKQILQTGEWNEPNGISIGGMRTQGVNFFSKPDPVADLFPNDNDPSPHVHLTDWASEFPNLPEGFTRGARPHLDVAFFTRTRAEVLDDPNAGEELGQRLIATQVPESTGIWGLGILGLSSLWVRKR